MIIEAPPMSDVCQKHTIRASTALYHNTELNELPKLVKLHSTLSLHSCLLLWTVVYTLILF